jgi:hypothetical protein
VTSSQSLGTRSNWKERIAKEVMYEPFILGPVNVPPTIGMTTRSCPVGIGPSEKRSPNSASMLYSSVIFGATGASCAIVNDAKAAIAVSGLMKRIVVVELQVRLSLVGDLSVVPEQLYTYSTGCVKNCCRNALPQNASSRTGVL